MIPGSGSLLERREGAAVATVLWAVFVEAKLATGRWLQHL